ncbi:hypothetical protein LX81_03288 [Palleronia aestuarii]|uniref:Uncharacterized protein n=1 Tax=Palleronia aestuarii TaxID=568105 RepID=A0A2W7N155_9RHOB|nr:hypothetical protein [Palleronia aestuarii]PZX13503.1 hypothetical protein LX81_03288 [Palleronia aestuarii]
MALVLVLVGILTGLASMITAFLADMGILASLLAYPVGGMAGLLCTAGILMLCPAVPVRPAFVAAEGRD